MSEQEGRTCGYKLAGPRPAETPPCEEGMGFYDPCPNCTEWKPEPLVPAQPTRLFHVVDYHPYPVGETLWLGGKELHIPWSQYDITLCGNNFVGERETLERKSATRQDKDVCEKCEQLNQIVLAQYLDHKRSTREHQ